MTQSTGAIGNLAMQDQVIGQFNVAMCVITMIFKLRTKALFEFLRLRRKSPPNLWQFGLAVQEVIAVRTSLAMTGKLSAAEAHRMVEEKRLAVVRAYLACTEAILNGQGASAPRVASMCIGARRNLIASDSASVAGAGRDKARARVTSSVNRVAPGHDQAQLTACPAPRCGRDRRAGRGCR